MNEEMNSLKNNGTWDLVKFPVGRKAIGYKQVYKKKLNVDKEVEKYIPQLVSKDYSQVEGVDFGQVFSPLVKLTFIHFMLSIDVVFDSRLRKWM